jgi:hypothetical protein
MLLDLCSGNYRTSDVLVNGVDGIVKDYKYIFSTPLLWIKRF